MLLSAEIYYEILTNECFKLGKNMPTLINTELGWILAGRISQDCEMSSKDESKLCNVGVQHHNNNNNAVLVSCGNKRKICFYCKKNNHKLEACRKFSLLSIEKRKAVIWSKGLCYLCLDKHFLLNCKSTLRCELCSRRHNTLIHQEYIKNKVVMVNHSKDNKCQNKAQKQNVNKNSINRVIDLHTGPTPRPTMSLPVSNQNSFMPKEIPEFKYQSTDIISQSLYLSKLKSDFNKQNNSGILPQSQENKIVSYSKESVMQPNTVLATTEVNIISKNGDIISAVALLDSGSQTSFITKSLVNKIQSNMYNHSLNTSSNPQVSFNKMTDVIIHSKKESVKYPVSCIILDTIIHKIPQESVSLDNLNLSEEIKSNLANSKFYVSSEIDLILDANIYFSCLKGHSTLGTNCQGVIPTTFGYIIA